VKSSSKPTKKANEQPTKQSLGKQKELCYIKALQKDNAEEPSSSFCFNVLAQLANIPVRITLYEFLKLSKSMKEALDDLEAFISQIPAVCKEEDDRHCL